MICTYLDIYYTSKLYILDRELIKLKTIQYENFCSHFLGELQSAYLSIIIAFSILIYALLDLICNTLVTAIFIHSVCFILLTNNTWFLKYVFLNHPLPLTCIFMISNGLSRKNVYTSSFMSTRFSINLFSFIKSFR